MSGDSSSLKIHIYYRPAGSSSASSCLQEYGDEWKDPTRYAVNGLIGEIECSGSPSIQVIKKGGETAGIRVGSSFPDDTISSGTEAYVAIDGTNNRPVFVSGRAGAEDYFGTIRQTEHPTEERTVSSRDRFLGDISLAFGPNNGSEKTPLGKGLGGETRSHEQLFNGFDLRLRLNTVPSKLFIPDKFPNSRFWLEPLNVAFDIGNIRGSTDGGEYNPVYGEDVGYNIAYGGAKGGLSFSYDWFRQLAKGRTGEAANHGNWDAFAGVYTPIAVYEKLNGNWSSLGRSSINGVGESDVSAFDNVEVSIGGRYKNFRGFVACNRNMHIAGEPNFSFENSSYFLGVAYLFGATVQSKRSVPGNAAVAIGGETRAAPAARGLAGAVMERPFVYRQVNMPPRPEFSAKEMESFASGSDVLFKRQLSASGLSRSEFRAGDRGNLQVNPAVYRAANVIEKYIAFAGMAGLEDAKLDISISAYADSVGPKASNLDLSNRRSRQFSNELRAELERRGVAGVTMKAPKGYGEDKVLVYYCETDKGRCTPEDVKFRENLRVAKIGDQDVEPIQPFFDVNGDRVSGGYSRTKEDGYGHIVYMEDDGTGASVEKHALEKFGESRRVVTKMRVKTAFSRIQPAASSAEERTVDGAKIIKLGLPAVTGIASVAPYLNEDELSNLAGAIQRAAGEGVREIVVTINLAAKDGRDDAAKGRLTKWIGLAAQKIADELEVELPIGVMVSDDDRIRKDEIFVTAVTRPNFETLGNEWQEMSK